MTVLALISVIFGLVVAVATHIDGSRRSLPEPASRCYTGRRKVNPHTVRARGEGYRPVVHTGARKSPPQGSGVPRKTPPIPRKSGLHSPTNEGSVDVMRMLAMRLRDQGEMDIDHQYSAFLATAGATRAVIDAKRSRPEPSPPPTRFRRMSVDSGYLTHETL